MKREDYDSAFFQAIERQSMTVPHTPGWKPLIDLVWEELEKRSLVGDRDMIPVHRSVLDIAYAELQRLGERHGLSYGADLAVIRLAAQLVPLPQNGT